MNSQHPVTGDAGAQASAAAARHRRRRGHRRKPGAAPRVLAVIAGSVALGAVGSWYVTLGPPAGTAAGTRPAATVPDGVLDAQRAEPHTAPTAPVPAPSSAAAEPSATQSPTAAASATAAVGGPSPTATATGRATRPSAAAPTALAAPAPASTAAAPASGGGKAAQFAGQVADLVNAERAKHGCGPVSVNSKLQSAAQVHSDDMSARQYFEHADPEGRHADSRITAAGYRWSSWGENIARGQQDPAAVMDAWMNSPGHRANILNCDFKEIGVGVNFGSGGPWWTQVFAAAG